MIDQYKRISSYSYHDLEQGVSAARSVFSKEFYGPVNTVKVMVITSLSWFTQGVSSKNV